jgi:hypothetical protein
MAVHDAWNTILWGYVPYSNDQLSVLFDLIFEEYNSAYADHPYIFDKNMEYHIHAGDFTFTRDSNGRATVEFEQGNLPCKADSKHFKNNMSNDILSGLKTEFEKMPLLMHKANRMTQLMIKWRLLIGR